MNKKETDIDKSFSNLNTIILTKIIRKFIAGMRKSDVFFNPNLTFTYYPHYFQKSYQID